MQVSSRSWHMQLTRLVFGDDYRPENLCKHFWATIGAMPLVVLGLALVAVVGSLYIVGGVIIFPIYGTRTVSRLTEGPDARPWWCRAEKRPKQYKVREPNLFIEWIKAKKQKVCPLITVVEAEEN